MIQDYRLPGPNVLLCSTQVSPVDALPVDPARVNPLHLPALAHVASELDGITHPIRIVAPADLDECSACPEPDVDMIGAIGTVVAYDPYGHAHRDLMCALHLDAVVRHHARLGRHLVVEIPASTRQWFARDDRETYFALDEHVGIGVVRGMWDCWVVVHAVDGYGAEHALAVFPGRVEADCYAQDFAASLAAHAYEAASQVAETVALPAAATEDVAA